ncbi:MAG: Ig-like domain-containing protein [Roseburia faecis]
MLLVAIILHQLLFTNPVFPTLPRKIPSIFPVKVTYKTSTKKSAKAKTKKLTYTLKVAKASVALSGDSAVAVGSTTKLTTTKKASSRAKITYTSSDESVATVAADGTVTGVKAGKATITATLTIGKDTATATQEVEVKKFILNSVTQSKLRELTVTVAGDTKALKATDFTVVNPKTNVKYPVSKIAVDSKDATKVTLTMFADLSDAADYDVTLDGITKSFKATDGKVASISVSPLTIPYATEKEITLVSKDTNGVIVKELPYGKADSSYTFTINTNGNGYTSGSNLYLNKAGDTATAEIAYKSGKYDKDGKPVDDIAAQKVTITAVDQSAVSEFAVKIDKAGKSFDKAKDTNKIAVEDTARTTAYFKIKDADGKEVSDSVYNKYTVESSDKSVLMLDSNTITVDSNKTRSVVLKGVKVGTAYLLFKDRDNKIVGSVAIDVVAKREVASITLDKNYLTISNTANSTRTVKATLKDQYGDDWSLSTDYIQAEYKDSSNGEKLSGVTATGNKVTVNVASAKIGTYNYYIQYWKDGKNPVSQVLTIVVSEPTDKADVSKIDSYRVSFDNETVDTTVKEGNLDQTTDSATVNAELIGVAGGVDKTVVSDSQVIYTVKKSDGSVIFGYEGNEAAPTTGTVKTNAAIQVDTNTVGSSTDLAGVTGNKLKISVVSTSAIGYKAKNLGAGSYTVIARYNGKVYTSNFVISDNQGKASVTFTPEYTSSNVLQFGSSATVKQALEKAIQEVDYNGYKINSASLASNIVKVEGTINNVPGKVNVDITNDTIARQNNFTVTKLVVKVKVPDTNVYTDVEVDLPNTVITIQ